MSKRIPAKAVATVRQASRISFEAVDFGPVAGLDRKRWVADAEEAFFMMQVTFQVLKRSPEELVEMFRKAPDKVAAMDCLLGPLAGAKKWLEDGAAALGCAEARIMIAAAKMVENWDQKPAA